MQRTLADSLPELIETFWLANQFDEYVNSQSKIRQLVRDGWITRLRPGLYIRSDAYADPNVLGLAANRIYGPSYVSFTTALRRHGMIPEAVPNITSATYAKRRRKRFHTPVGSFFYRDVPTAVFAHGVDLAGEKNGARYLIAGPQKALLDQLSTVPGVRSRSALTDLLFEDLRIEAEVLSELDFTKVVTWAPGYRSDAVQTLLGSLKGGRVEL